MHEKKTSYHDSLTSCDTQSGNKAGLFYQSRTPQEAVNLAPRHKKMCLKTE